MLKGGGVRGSLGGGGLSQVNAALSAAIPSQIAVEWVTKISGNFRQIRQVQENVGHLGCQKLREKKNLFLRSACCHMTP